MTMLNSSVGYRGKNNPFDVVKVQQQLNAHLGVLAGERKLIVDGICGAQTILAIRRFQVQFLGMQKPDGRVDAEGPTLARLFSSPRHILPEATEDYWSGDSHQWSHHKKLQSLNADFSEKVQAVLVRLESLSWRPKIFYAWRSPTTQLSLYRSGRSRVTFSFHNVCDKDGVPAACAVDVIDRRYGWSDRAETTEFWQALGDAAHQQNLHWGGDWKKFRDYAHIQFYPNQTLAQLRQQQQGIA